MEEKWYKGRSQIGFVNLENYLDAMKRRLSLSLRILMIYSGLQVKIYYNLAVEKYRGPIFTRPYLYGGVCSETLPHTHYNP